jgi:hypothetical protein
MEFYFLSPYQGLPSSVYVLWQQPFAGLSIPQEVFSIGTLILLFKS